MYKSTIISQYCPIWEAMLTENTIDWWHSISHIEACEVEVDPLLVVIYD